MTAFKHTLSVIVPVYYNAESLPELMQRLCALEAQLNARHVGLELVFIDDGSGDDSFEVLLKLRQQRPTTKLIKHTRNFGGVASSWSAFPFVTGDCVALLSADLQDPPEQLLPMFEAWENGAKFVCSYRQTRHDPFFTTLFAKIYYAILTRFVVKNYPSTGTDMVLMDKSLLLHFTSLRQSVNYTLYLFWIGIEATLLPYTRQERKYGKSRWTFKRKLRYCIDTITGFSATPLRFISIIGLCVSLISLLYGVHIVAYALLHGTEVPGFTTLSTLISFSTAIIVTMLAIIGEYLWRIFEIMNDRPKSVIAEQYLHPSDTKELR
jgi:dolichol-phosphate mannosyltransferase